MVGQMTDQLTRVRQIEDALANAFKNRLNFGITAGFDGERWVHLASGHSLFVDAGLEQPSAGLWDLAVDMERELSAAGLIQ